MVEPMSPEIIARAGQLGYAYAGGDIFRNDLGQTLTASELYAITEEEKPTQEKPERPYFISDIPVRNLLSRTKVLE